MIKELSKTNGKDTVVGENVRVTGKLHTSGGIQINGEVKGEVSSEGSVVVGRTATIKGPITASDVKIQGTVRGNIVVQNELELDSEAKVFGDIQTKTLSIQKGAIFVGKSAMGEEEEKGAKEVKEKEEKKPEPELEIE